MLELKGIYKTFNPGSPNEKRALNGVDLVLEEGDFVTIIGGNGAGKSTTLNAIAGAWPVDEGQIIIDGVDVTHLPEHKRAAYLGRVFQDPMNATAADMEIEENLAIAKRRGTKRTLKWGITKKERLEYVELLKMLDLGLETRMNTKVGLLSGGQRQALTLLMATLKKPKLLLLDEAFSALDYQTRVNVSRDVYNILRGENQTMIMVTPDIPEAVSMSDRIVILSRRPATIARMVTTPFDTDRDTVAVRTTAEYGQCYDTVWKEMSR